MQMNTELAPNDSSLYEPIHTSSRDIRVIIVHPPSSNSNQQSEIRCSLVRQSLDHNPRFEALSYSWGDAGPEKNITVNGVAVSVRENLWDALFHLRECNNRYLWIDAICIDQDNTTERSHQVQQMSQIYSQAWRVVIWLGLESDDSKEALEFLNPLSPSSISQQTVSMNFDRFLHQASAVWNLCARPYWRRLWIVQEVVLARNARVQCGRDYASWDDFNNFRITWEKEIGIEYAARSFLDPRKNMAFVLDKHRLRVATLRDLLKAFQTSLCSDIRDKVYGLAGLAVDGEKLRIDYSKSTFEIFADVLSLQQDDSGSLIEFAGFLQRVLEFHPWDDIPESKCLSTDYIEADGRESAIVVDLGPLISAFDPPQQGLEHGACVDSDTLWNIGNHLSLKATCRIRREVIAIHSPVSYGLRAGQNFAPSSYSSRNWARASALSSSAPRTYAHIAPRTRQATQGLQAKQRADEEMAQEYGEAAPRFFIDSQGHVGILPSNARIGDVVCCFDYCSAIAVLRWSGDRYLLVGKAVFVELRDNQVSFVTPQGPLRRGEQIELFVNAYTVYLLTK